MATPTKEPNIEQNHKVCPECGYLMKAVTDTKQSMTGDVEDDDTILDEYWQCPNCDYYEYL